MSPTSYQTAPPRISSLSCGERERQLLVNFSRCILVGAKRLIPLARPIILNRRHLDRLTHFKEAGTSPHADALFEEVLALNVVCQTNGAAVARFRVAQVGGDDRRLPVITSVGDDRSNRVLHPIRHAVSAQVVEDNNFGVKRGAVGFLVAGSGRFVIAAPDTIEKILKIKEDAFEPPRQQAA